MHLDGFIDRPDQRIDGPDSCRGHFRGHYEGGNFPVGSAQRPADVVHLLVPRLPCLLALDVNRVAGLDGAHGRVVRADHQVSYRLDPGDGFRELCPILRPLRCGVDPLGVALGGPKGIALARDCRGCDGGYRGVLDV